MKQYIRDAIANGHLKREEELAKAQQKEAIEKLAKLQQEQQKTDFAREEAEKYMAVELPASITRALSEGDKVVSFWIKSARSLFSRGESRELVAKQIEALCKEEGLRTYRGSEEEPPYDDCQPGDTHYYLYIEIPSI